MVEGGRDLDFPKKPFGPQCGRELGAQKLDRDETRVLEIAGQVNRGHPALTEFALDQISTSERGR